MTGAEFSEVDFDLLADYVGGALDGTPDEAVVAALVVGHPGWRRAHADLVEATGAMTAELRAWGDEAEPMPVDVVARLDAAFAVAAGGAPGAADAGLARPSIVDAGGADVHASTDAVSGDDPVAAASGNGHAADSGVRPRLSVVKEDLAERDLDGAASGPGQAVAADDGGGLGAGSVLTPGGGVASGPHRVGVPNDGERPTTARRRARRLKWAAPIGIAAGVVAFLGFGVQQFGGGDAQDSATSAAGSAPEANQALALPAGPGEVLASGTDYDEGTLAQAAARAMAAPAEGGSAAPEPLTVLPHTRASGAQGKAAKPSAGAMADTGDPLNRLKVQEALLACLDAISDVNGAGPITAQRLDYARFDGVPALIVQFTAGNGSWVWATGAGCGTPGSGADKLGAAKVG